jgi:hypothetical protein
VGRCLPERHSIFGHAEGTLDVEPITKQRNSVIACKSSSHSAQCRCSGVRRTRVHEVAPQRMVRSHYGSGKRRCSARSPEVRKKWGKARRWQHVLGAE